MDIILAVAPLLTGWALDLVAGDPAWMPHPVVGFGKAISFFEHRLNHGAHRVAKGAFMAVGLIMTVYLLALTLMDWLTAYPWVKCGVEAILIFFCLAGTTLVREVKMVFRAVDRSLDEGRRQVGRIVGRDTASLSAQEIRTAALETLAENLSDGVIAPLFWYMILGVPGMLAYKMVNTLDSMTGYRNERFRDFGRWAARIDDFANYLPARITAFLMVVASGRLSLLAFVRRYGRCHASPNSGYPEAALAGILGCRFGGAHDYFGETVYKPFIGENPRELTSRDMTVAIRINLIAEILMIIIVLATRI
ncbi:MAG: cobalamin biosynthesis protein CobD [Bacteroidales bacterium]|nr:MAG: cobalamin biosynthesis protein CobD [Bacteroidales bacterium]